MNRPNNQAQPGKSQNYAANAAGPSEEAEANPAEQPIRVDGFAQVLAMLKIADPEFRESLLRRLGQRDPSLARTLRRDLGI